jgi:hypothetical protein
MADQKTTIRKLMSKDDALIEKVINKATDEYFKFLREIAEDIYDSCIQVYYDKYEPKVYKRHGYPEGKNLYYANDMSYENDFLDFNADASRLMKYGNTGFEKKQEVLHQVMSGLRGTKTRHKVSDNYEPEHEWETENLENEWPMDWSKYCTYPNYCSQYNNRWKSTKNTMYDIFKEFQETGIVSTTKKFWDIVAKYI